MEVSPLLHRPPPSFVCSHLLAVQPPAVTSKPCQPLDPSSTRLHPLDFIQPSSVEPSHVSCLTSPDAPTSASTNAYHHHHHVPSNNQHRHQEQKGRPALLDSRPRSRPRTQEEQVSHTQKEADPRSAHGRFIRRRRQRR